MSGIESYIAGSEKLIAIYGGWPTFHDAEVIDFHLWRGNVKPGDWDDSNVMPVITAKIHIWTESQQSQHTLATLRFHDVDQVAMEGFNHLNQIYEFSIDVQPRGTFTNGEDLPPFLMVKFRAAFGMSASFRCFRIEVADAAKCAEDGTPQGVN